MNLLPNNGAKLVYVLVLIGLFTGGLLLAQWAPWSDRQKSSNGYAHLGGNFTLNSQQGEVALTDFKGQLVLIYFGFTSCPEVCPTALSSMAASMRELGPELEQKVQPLFVSVDPARDTLDNLAAYSAYFHPRMLGLTGSLEYLDNLVQQYGAYYRHIPLENSALGYTVDHTSRIYVIDAQGKLITTLAHGTSVDEIVNLLKQHL
ncbi:MAG: SCO family protein [Oceanospirillaceae bacterium]|jgi:protein SCO1/2|nr:SCO family protein [Oceanospirillaceae bacterium]